MEGQENDEFLGKTVLITGSSRGLGRATAVGFARRGARVVINYRVNETAAADALDEVTDAHRKSDGIAVQADLSDREGVDHLFDRVQEECGELDVFVHNAAVTAFKALDEVTEKDISLTFDVCINAFLLGSQRALELMNEEGRIIAVSGNDSYKYMPLHGLLGGAKAALEQLVSYLAVEQAPRNIPVNAVNPGIIDKPEENYYTTLTNETEAAMAQMREEIPMGRAPTAEEVADAILMVAGDDAQWVTGQTINVDGGLSNM